MLFTWLLCGKPDVSMTFNAALAGLVGITAGCGAQKGKPEYYRGTPVEVALLPINLF